MMRMSGRYGDPRRAPQSVPRALALGLARERDAYAQALDRARARIEELEAAARASRVEEGSLERAEASEPEPEPEPERARLGRRVQELMGDLERLKRRQRLELDERSRKGARDALAGMLEVRDNMVRALALLAGEGGPWEEGFASVLGQLDGALERAGVRAFGEVGERFDPMIHEAVGMEPGGDVAPGELRRVERVGFRFADGGALLRPALVVVAA